MIGADNMQKIKISFKRVLPFAVVFCFALMTTGNIAERLSNMIAANMDIINVAGSVWTGIMLFFKVAVSAALSPLYVGFYKFCFERVNGKNPHILTAFDFYRSAGKILGSVIAVQLGTVVSRVFFVLMALLFWNASHEAVNIAGFLTYIISWIILMFFTSMPYLYAENKDIGIGAAMKLSFKIGLKYILVFILVNILTTLTEVLYTIAAFTVRPDKMMFTDYISLMGAGFGIGRTLMRLIENVFAVWAEFTAVWCIFEREKDNMLKDFFAKFKSGNGSEEVSENTEDTPFIEPYDFCIEADERFRDEKVIETENIRGVDILAALEEMDLAFDVVNHFGIRRRLKKMFDDLAFDIGEYVSYQDGKTVENEFTEEIDDRAFTVSVTISRSSDYEPFILNIRVDSEEE